MHRLDDVNLYFVRAHARHPDAALPGFVGSPMDDRITLAIAHSVIEDCEKGLFDPELLRSMTGTPRRIAG